MLTQLPIETLDQTIAKELYQEGLSPGEVIRTLYSCKAVFQGEAVVLDLQYIRRRIGVHQSHTDRPLGINRLVETGTALLQDMQTDQGDGQPGVLLAEATLVSVDKGAQGQAGLQYV